MESCCRFAQSLNLIRLYDTRRLKAHRINRNTVGIHLIWTLYTNSIRDSLACKMVALKTVLLTFFYYGSWLVFPCLVFVVWQFQKLHREKTRAKSYRIALVAYFCISLVFVWSRFIEPQLITVREHHIDTGFSARLVVVSDLHLGVYKSRAYLERVVKRINQLDDVDAVLVAGDFTYEPQKDLEAIFAPFSKSRFLVFGVLGNHDSEHPGRPLKDRLIPALESSRVHILHNQEAQLGDIILLGLGSHLANEDQTSLLLQYTDKENLIVLAHNPDSVLSYPNDVADLTVSGHTHGGQIRVPWLYKNLIPVKGGFDQGLYDTHKGRVFVTPGLGEIMLPLRFMIAPVIDVLVLR